MDCVDVFPLRSRDLKLFVDPHLEDQMAGLEFWKLLLFILLTPSAMFAKMVLK